GVEPAFDFIGNGRNAALEAAIGTEAAGGRVADVFFDFITRTAMDDLGFRSACTIDIQARMPRMKAEHELRLYRVDPFHEGLIFWLRITFGAGRIFLFGHRGRPIFCRQISIEIDGAGVLSLTG